MYFRDVKNQYPNETAGAPRVAPPLTGGALLNLDGQCFEGPSGLLAVALSESALQSHLRGAKASHWVLPLEATWVARHLPQIDGKVMWISSRPPKSVIGALDENVEGAWIEGTNAVLRIEGMERHLIVQAVPSAAFVIAYLARLLVSEWAGDNETVAEVTRFSQGPTAFGFAA